LYQETLKRSTQYRFKEVHGEPVFQPINFLWRAQNGQIAQSIQHTYGDDGEIIGRSLTYYHRTPRVSHSVVQLDSGLYYTPSADAIQLTLMNPDPFETIFSGLLEDFSTTQEASGLIRALTATAADGRQIVGIITPEGLDVSIT
jgi:hypothetical protein